ncbi:MAG: HAD family hydrolase [Gammaproteobacteria bacterium]|nr:HAD family hydrolase [Gammaproteobacteria bacterium]
MNLQALIFDVDGTLADTERDGHRVAFNAAFKEAGLDWHWHVDLYGELLAVTGGKERMHHYIERYRPDYKKPADFDALVARLHAAKTQHYTALLARGGIPLRPGVWRLLEEARRHGMRLAIATTTTPANVSALLRHALSPAAESWFEIIGAGDVVAAKKPAPDIYHYVLEHLQLAPAQCLAFEDSENGLRAAQAARLRTVITINDYTRTHDFSGAALVLDHLGEADQPFNVLAGPAVNGATFLDLNLLQKIFIKP